MARLVVAAPLDFCQALLEIYTVNDRINQILLEHLDPHAWRAKPPGGRGRTIAAIFAHIHNIRRKWVVVALPQLVDCTIATNDGLPERARVGQAAPCLSLAR